LPRKLSASTTIVIPAEAHCFLQKGSENPHSSFDPIRRAAASPRVLLDELNTSVYWWDGSSTLSRSTARRRGDAAK
jgi:hypothetical protein